MRQPLLCLSYFIQANGSNWCFYFNYWSVPKVRPVASNHELVGTAGQTSVIISSGLTCGTDQKKAPMTPEDTSSTDQNKLPVPPITSLIADITKPPELEKNITNKTRVQKTRLSFD